MPVNIGNPRKRSFKKYEQPEELKLSVHVSKLIPEGHISRIIDKIIEGLSLEALSEYYPGGGSSAYHPKLMLKVWLYGYCEGIYTSRPLAKALVERIPMIWLSGGQTPSFKTLSDFRSNRMEGMVDLVFQHVLLILLEEGYIDLEDLFIDGSKWEANANRHKIIWSKNTARYKGQVQERIRELLSELKALQTQEDAQYGNKNLAQMGDGKSVELVLSSAQVSEQLGELNQLIENKSEQKVAQKYLKKISRKLKEEQLKLFKYEEQEQLLCGRNSYSKTDLEATAFRMKDERLLPAYNVQNMTNNQFIVNYTIEQYASDSITLARHLDKFEEREQGMALPSEQNISTDAGYGSEENYELLEERRLNGYVKYGLFDREKSGKLAKAKFRRENFPYDPKADEFSCPQGRKLTFVEERTFKNSNGYERTSRFYQSQSCENCPVASECKRSPDKPRTVSFSPKGEVYKERAKALLNSEKGKQLRKERGYEVEGSFGQIKFNMKHRRFILRERQKVYIEYGLLAIGHNLKKIYCKKSGIWADFYAQRAARKAKKRA